jgi:hypothetical protein
MLKNVLLCSIFYHQVNHLHSKSCGKPPTSVDINVILLTLCLFGPLVNGHVVLFVYTNILHYCSSDLTWENHHCEKHGNTQIAPNPSHKLWRGWPLACLEDLIKPHQASHQGARWTSSVSMLKVPVLALIIETSAVWPWCRRSFQDICRGLWIIYLWLISHDLSHGVPLVIGNIFYSHSQDNIKGRSCRSIIPRFLLSWPGFFCATVRW